MSVKRKVSEAQALANLKRKFGNTKEFTLGDIRTVFHIGLASAYTARLLEAKRLRRVGRNRYKLG